MLSIQMIIIFRCDCRHDEVPRALYASPRRFPGHRIRAPGPRRREGAALQAPPRLPCRGVCASSSHSHIIYASFIGFQKAPRRVRPFARPASRATASVHRPAYALPLHSILGRVSKGAAAGPRRLGGRHVGIILSMRCLCIKNFVGF